MAQGYPRSGYQTSSATLPPLRNGNGTARGYYDHPVQPSPSATPILPSQMAPDGDRYGSAGPAAFDPPGSAHGTPP